MKIGYLLCAYNQIEYIDQVLSVLAKYAKDHAHEISCVSVPFAAYKDLDVGEDGTLGVVREAYRKGEIHYLIDSPRYITDPEARTLAIQPLLASECDVIMLVDADELLQYDDYVKIEKFVKKHRSTVWFKLALKNCVGTGYLEEPFCPPRVFRTRYKDYRLNIFFDENDVNYCKNDKIRNQSHFKWLQIPQRLAWPLHCSWLNNEKSRKKIAYQTLRWGADGCSYRWGAQGIEQNPDFYERTGKAMPRILPFDTDQENVAPKRRVLIAWLRG